jgi:hypothetical protein
MKIITNLVVTSLVILISSCAVGPSDKYGRADLATEDGQVCKKQKVVGSQIPTRVCGSPKTMALLEARSAELLRRMSRKPNYQGEKPIPGG